MIKVSFFGLLLLNSQHIFLNPERRGRRLRGELSRVRDLHKMGVPLLTSSDKLSYLKREGEYSFYLLECIAAYDGIFYSHLLSYTNRY